MSIIFQKDRRSGITYAYENSAYWDKEKKQSRTKRKLIGRLNAETGEIVPTDGRCRKLSPNFPEYQQHQEQKAQEVTEKKSGRIPTMNTKRLFCGATYLFDEIVNHLGLRDDLKTCFPHDYKSILSIAYYMILEDTSPLYRFDKWSMLHRHPLEGNIPSQRSSELFTRITEESKTRFFKLRLKRCDKDEYWAYDTTSISSYSQLNNMVRYGNNKDGEPLPQVNCLLLFGQTSNLPISYRMLAGNISDVSTLKATLHECLTALDCKSPGFIMDRGFYRKDNINELYRNHCKFIVGAKTSVNFIRNIIREKAGEMKSWNNYRDEYGIYARGESIEWDYEQKRPYKGDTLQEKRRMYAHIYLDVERCANEEAGFMRKLRIAEQELQAGKEPEEISPGLRKYFTVNATKDGKRRIEADNKAIAETMAGFGYFVLLSNKEKDPVRTLELYRNRDVVEKAFSDIKSRLNANRSLTSSEHGMNGKMFVAFVALIILSHLKRKMQEQQLFKQYSIATLLDELDVIECFSSPGHRPFVGEVLKKQSELYTQLGVTPLHTGASLG